MSTKTNTSADFRMAIDAIRDEMAERANNGVIQTVGGVLTALLQKHPELADKLSGEKKNLQGAVEAMKDEAAKQKTGTCACLDGMTGMKIVLKYYGIDSISDRELADAIMDMMLGGTAPAPKPDADEFDIEALLGEV